MNRRAQRWLLVLYPRAWRLRYGAEVADLTRELISEGETTPLRAGLNLIVSAGAERLRALARFAVLAPVATGLAVVAGIVLALARGQHGGPAAKPYFYGHAAGVALLIVAMAWCLAEFIMFLQVQERQGLHEGATKTREPHSFRASAVGCVIAVNIWLYAAPAIFPSATIRPGAAACTAGMAMLAAGIGLRLWSFKTLGRYFTYAIVVSRLQPVITAGPYRIVRHPSYAGGLLAYMGIGLMSANWAALTAMTLLPLMLIVWHIRTEESALLAMLGGKYRSYASRHRHLIPLVW